MKPTETTPSTPLPPETQPRQLPADGPTVARVTVVTALGPVEPTAKVLRRTWTFVSRNRTIVLFALMLLGTDRVIGRFAAVWDRHSPDDYAARVKGCAREQRDLVFIGGSPVAEGINPDRVAGVAWAGKPLASAYAMGLSGGTTSDFYHAVLRGCPTPPRVLVYGITASDLNDSRHEPHGPYSLMTTGDVGRWVRLRPDSAEWVVRHFAQARLGRASDLYRYRHGIRMWAATEADRQLPGSCPEAVGEADELRERADALRTGNGYAPARGYSVGRYDAVKAAGLRPKEFPYLRKYRTGSHLKYLHELAIWCGVRGVDLVLVDMPVTADLEAMYPAEFAEYRARLAEVEQGAGLRVIRASRAAVGLTDTHFADLIHMNREGAKVFSGWVRSELGRCGQ
ncbi:MAG: hypothetical protein JWO38_2929 [Gemmataceae bacterium]|nr:hypothetical protein [Gemmataceae bacterium]